MFSDSDRDFMAKKMKIVVESIELKLNNPLFLEIKGLAIDLISKSIKAINELEASRVPQNICLGLQNEAEKSINSHFCNITSGMEKNEQYQVLDALRHSFFCYAGNGLRQLYLHQENESWYPKIFLTEVLEPNDIESLPQSITLYRGCDISELATKSFGQAWSISLEVAKKFAYSHYQDKEWFNVNNRVVLGAVCSRNDVLFSDQTTEFEVVVNVEKLKGVHKHA